MKVAVVGAGAMGSWTSYFLLKTGAEVVLIDQFGPGNSKSSSGGETRAIRHVYGKDTIYIEWVKRSIDLWDQLQKKTNSRLLLKTGALWMFQHNDRYMSEALPHLNRLAISIDNLNVQDAAKKFPQFNFDDIRHVYWENGAGVLYARKSIQHLVQQFVAEGGKLQFGQVIGLQGNNENLRSLNMSNGNIVEADHFILACGPWISNLVEGLSTNIFVSRQEIYYFAPPDQSLALGKMPGWFDFGDEIHYGFPSIDHRGFKVANDTRGHRFDPDSEDRMPLPDLLQAAKEYVIRRFKKVQAPVLSEGRVCQYTNSADGQIIIDHHPEYINTLLLAGGSGHSFKFSPALGEYVSSVIQEGKSIHPTFRLGSRSNQVQWS